MAEALVFQCQGYYDWEFDDEFNKWRGQILLGTVIWESEKGYYDEEVAQEAAIEHLRSKIGGLLSE
jgi:hypothetical protein